ncbi:MAG: hypothetical protein PHT88_04250 [Candidatus Moranbacteria bacterium]|nr:hypothetical protein [Candidatus Moranbacteria bacterium]
MAECDTDKHITPIEVRDVIISCFAIAHQNDISMSFQNADEIRIYCGELVKKFFTDIHEDFDNPSKEALLKILNCLADFAKNFRDQAIIQKNYQKMIALVNDLD